MSLKRPCRTAISGAEYCRARHRCERKITIVIATDRGLYRSVDGVAGLTFIIDNLPAHLDAANNVWYTDLSGWLGMLPRRSGHSEPS